ncbi:MAG: tRNA (adenosine(37)-N6)-threonylcarbamoyltransferase complex ATPase subunit type 1 TsaE [Candidatus Latescibacteria bacterium]|nr:tRNA (adenosine(37)-N6)-threonylcarbamoyltransferase complex ATPase subunit type 1 TsaE [Candidatus Latescibacterota bacterium]
MTITTHSPEETRAFGHRLAERLGRGAIVACSGDLGAGKTCLIQGICEGLGVAEPVNSPTFIIANEHAGRLADGSSLPVYHLDLYRLERPEDLDNLGWEDYLYGDGVCLVEWADRAAHLLPEEAFRIRMEVAGEGQRRITVSE